MKPFAYVTYKGYLLHAEDPKLKWHSQPCALYHEDDVKVLQTKIDDLTLEIQHLKEELQLTKDQRSAAFRKIEELFGLYGISCVIRHCDV